MSRDRFKKVMFSPYFQSDHYSDTRSGKFEKRVEDKIKFIFNRLKAIVK